jgi:hypothetical protein
MVMPIKDMPMSQAMREGAKLRPQATEGWFKLLDDGRIGSCAVGAAAEAAHVFRPEVVETFVARYPIDVTARYVDAHKGPSDVWPVMLEQSPPAPCGCNPDSLPWDPEYVPLVQEVIIHLNDDHKWPRERIASWLAMVEKK